MAGFEGLIAPGTTGETKTSDGKKTSGEAGVPKEGPSLFDSMLSQLTGKEGSSSEESAEGENAKQNLATATKTKSSTGANPEAKAAANPALNKTAGASLFDKMVAQSQEGVTQTANLDGKNTSSQTKVVGENPEIKTTLANTTNPEVKTVNAKQNTQNISGTNTKNSINPVNNLDNSYTVSPEKIEEEVISTTKKDSKTNTLNQNKETLNIASDSKINKDVNTSEVKATQKQTTQINTSAETIEAKTQNVVSKEQTSNQNTKTQSEVKTQNNTIIPNKENTANNTAKTNIKENAQNIDTAKQGEQNKLVSQNGQNKISPENQNIVATKTTTNSQTAQSALSSNNTQKVQTNAVSTKENTAGNTTNNTLVNTKDTAVKMQDTTNSKAENKLAINKEENPLQTKQKDVKTSNEPVKKSLADSLISNATATALADKTVSKDIMGEANNSNKVVVNKTGEVKTTNISQPNTAVNLSSPTQTNTAEITQNTQDISNVKNEIKTSQDTIVDNKLENKNTDILRSEQKQQIIKDENNQTLKAAATVPLTNASPEQSSSTTNQELANSLASIRDTAKIELSSISEPALKNTLKETLKKEETLLADKKQQNNSLLDKMIKETQNTSTQEESSNAQSLGSKNQFVQKDLPLFATAGYLHDQKRRNDIANMMNKNEGVKQALDAKSIGDVKSSAQTLGLNASEAEVTQEVVQKEEIRVQNTRDDMLKRMAFDNNLGRKLHNNEHQIKTNEAIVAKASAQTNTSEEKAVELAVSAEATQTIENRIIGARQTLRTMMSDVARQMAQNYKPPLTAFRINLNPNGLGNIAVVIKSEQSSGISISLNMSNTNTLETFVDNQSQLRAALTRNFDSNTSFNLDFGMQQDSNSQQNQDSNSNQNQNSSSNTSNSETNILVEQHSTEEMISQSNYM